MSDLTIASYFPFRRIKIINQSVDPDALKAWDSNDNRQLHYRELFQHDQMINRSDGVVTCVMINGEPVWQEGDVTAALGSRPLGRALRAA